MKKLTLLFRFCQILTLLQALLYVAVYSFYIISAPAGTEPNFPFYSSRILELAILILWFVVFGKISRTLQNGTANRNLPTELTGLGRVIIAIFTIDIVQNLLEVFSKFEHSLDIALGTIQLGTNPVVNNSKSISLTFDVSDKVAYLLPVTQGWATLLLGFIFLTAAKIYKENFRMKSELDTVI